MSNVYAYSVSENNVVSIWNNLEKSGSPVIIQPSNPDGSDWEYEAAIYWAETKVSNLIGNKTTYPTPLLSTTVNLSEELLES
jgi:hypothetical protein